MTRRLPPLPLPLPLPLPVLVSVLVLALAAPACTRRPKVQSIDVNIAGGGMGTAYGQLPTNAPLVAIGDLLAKPADYEGKTVRVIGVVSSVCPKRGCWIKIASDDAAGELTFKVTDGVIVFPLSAAGKRANAEGVVVKRDLSIEETRELLAHEAEEQGKPFDPASVTKPMTYVRLNGLGAVIADRN